MAEMLISVLVQLLSMPFVCLARFAEVWNMFGISSDIRKCINVIDSQNILLPSAFIDSLVTAEDHRNSVHPGVDPIGILRAIYVRVRHGERQGASTIEQQFVRVVTGRYEQGLSRKTYEQILAICVSRYRRKFQIANAYLAIAYYGTEVIGLRGLRAKLGSEFVESEIGDVRAMIARLKYPEPSRPTDAWRRRVDARVTYIELRESQLRRHGCRNYSTVSSLVSSGWSILRGRIRRSARTQSVPR